jgi:hypothetical protein
MESSPTLRNVDSISSSTSTLSSCYKSPVKQLLEKMEEQNAQHLREHDTKTLEFRKRMKRLMDEENNKQHHPSDPRFQQQLQ